MFYNIANLGLIDDGDIVLDEAALALALLDHEATDLSHYEDLLSDVAARLEAIGSDADNADERADRLAKVLCIEFGFSGDRDTYDNPDNADLICVINRLRGLPISLSILYVAGARRVGWSADILNLPGHVLVMVGREAAPIVIDPFRGGMRVGVGEIAALLSPTTDSIVPPVTRITTMTNRAALVRLLLNQATRAEKAGGVQRALELYRRMTTIAPDHPHPWWERARLELIDMNVTAARTSLAAMLEVTREPKLRATINSTLASVTGS